MIELIVSDCTNISLPVYTTVAVIPPLHIPLWVHPYPIKRQDANQQHVLAMIYVYGKAENELNLLDPLKLYPGNVSAASQYAYESQDSGLMTTVIVMFDKGHVLNALDANGYYDITIVGYMHTGQFYFGTDEIWITD